MPTSAPPRVVCVGAATYDAIACVPRTPGPDERLLADEVVMAGGGPAATAAVTASRLGLDVSFVGAVGLDDQGRSVVEGLQAEGVDHSAVAVLPGRSTQSSVVLVAADTATRVICTLAAEPLVLGPDACEAVLAADWVHVDHLGWPAVTDLLAGLPAARRPRLSIDAGNPVVGGTTACAPVDGDLYAPTLERLREEQGDHADTDVDALLGRSAAPTVVVTMGAGGSAGRGPDGVVHRAPGVRPADLRSTLGAGDVFHGALLTAAVRGTPLRSALAYANTVAALSCRGVDGRSAVPDHDETVAALRAADHHHEEHV